MWNENLFFDGGERYTVGGGFEKCGRVGGVERGRKNISPPQEGMFPFVQWSTRKLQTIEICVWD
jgi:hypothetical protein